MPSSVRHSSPVIIALALLAWSAAVLPANAANGVPGHTHVVVVIMENKSYDEVRTQPYTSSLIASGAVLVNSFAVTHPSQPNYIALWAGSTLGVTNDVCPAPGTPTAAENFGHACEVAGLRWAAYSENLPTAGATGCSYDGNTSSGLYTRKHDPWTDCSNLNHLREKPYSDLATDIAQDSLPNLVFIIPNNCDNTHNSSTAGCGVSDGDNWLATHLPAIQAALGPDGLLILTWDEDDSSSANHILTVFFGPHVVPGFASGRSVTHYTIVRTISDALGLPAFGLAASESPITDVWDAPTHGRPVTWGRLKSMYYR